MIWLIVLVAVVWAALMPPLFTGGECTAEFEATTQRVEGDRKRLASSAMAAAYWREMQVRHSVLSNEQCRRAKPRVLQSCGDGALVVALVPVRNTICSLYRDDKVTIYLQYDNRDRLARLHMEMKPYQSLPLPILGTTLHWAR